MSSCVLRGDEVISLDDIDLAQGNEFLIDSEPMPTKFIAERLGNCIHKWQDITTDNEILQTVAGCTIEI